MKAQVKIISAILLVLIALSLTSAMLTWGLPLLERIHHEAIAERVARAFDQMFTDSLPRRIRYIAGYGGEEVFRLEVDGVWKLDTQENFLQFTFGSKLNVTPIGEWAPLPDEKGVIESCPPPNGTVGVNSPAVVCARTDQAIGIFNITYRIWFRPLCEELVNHECAANVDTYEVRLKQPQKITSSAKDIKIKLRRRYTEENLIIAEVDIFLA